MIMDGEASVHATTDTLDLGAVVLPNLEQDNTDRNRTSPFAFTNNKFEFRAVGSEANVSDANMVLDTAVAQALRDFADALEGTPAEGFHEAALDYCAEHLREHRRILFSGDGYSDAWHAEAEARGLVNLPTTAEALPAFVAPKNLALFSEMGVLTEAEAVCRYEVKLEKYNKLMNIEATTMVREARRTYRPVITAYATKVAKGLETIRAAGAEAAMAFEQATLNELCSGITAINMSIAKLDELHARAEGIVDGQAQAEVYAHECARRHERAAPRRGRDGGDRRRRLLACSHLRRHPVLRVASLRKGTGAFLRAHRIEADRPGTVLGGAGPVCVCLRKVPVPFLRSRSEATARAWRPRLHRPGRRRWRFDYQRGAGARIAAGEDRGPRRALRLGGTQRWEDSMTGRGRPWSETSAPKASNVLASGPVKPQAISTSCAGSVRSCSL